MDENKNNDDIRRIAIVTHRWVVTQMFSDSVYGRPGRPVAKVPSRRSPLTHKRALRIVHSRTQGV